MTKAVIENFEKEIKENIYKVYPYSEVKIKNDIYGLRVDVYMYFRGRKFGFSRRVDINEVSYAGYRKDLSRAMLNDIQWDITKYLTEEGEYDNC